MLPRDAARAGARCSASPSRRRRATDDRPGAWPAPRAPAARLSPAQRSISRRSPTPCARRRRRRARAAARRPAGRRAFPRRPVDPLAGARARRCWRLARARRRSTIRRRRWRRPPARACSPRCAKARRARAAQRAHRGSARRRQREPYFHGRLCWSPRTATATACSTATSASACATPTACARGLVRRRRDRVRGFHPAALPAHEGAFAMTVHKAQGSSSTRCGCSCRASMRVLCRASWSTPR